MKSPLLVVILAALVGALSGCKSESEISTNYIAGATPDPGTSVQIVIAAPSTTILNSSASTYFDLTYTNANTVSLTNSLVQMNTTGTAACSLNVTSGSTFTPRVTLTACSGDGTVSITVKPNSAVNPEGTAALASSPSGIFTVDNTAPAVPSGVDDGVHVLSLTTAPTISWSTSAGATSYEVAVGTTSGAADKKSWTSVGASLSNAPGSLTLIDGVKYYSSVRAVDGAGNRSATAAGDGWVTDSILDFVVNPRGAYSVRKLYRTYTGHAFKLRRSSDNVVQDFDFNANGDLDGAAITAWLSGANAHVVTWYDQTGGGHDATHANPGEQPLLIVGAINGHPVVRFDGNNQYLYASYPGDVRPDYFGVFKILTSSNSGILWSDQGNGYHLGSYYGIGAGGTPITGAGFANILGSDGGTRASQALTTGTYAYARVYYGIGAGVNASLFALNGNEITFTLAPGAFAAGSLTYLNLGRFNAGGHYQNGELAELIIYPSAQSTADRLKFETSFKAYFGL